MGQDGALRLGHKLEDAVATQQKLHCDCDPGCLVRWTGETPAWFKGNSVAYSYVLALAYLDSVPGFRVCGPLSYHPTYKPPHRATFSSVSIVFVFLRLPGASVLIIIIMVFTCGTCWREFYDGWGARDQHCEVTGHSPPRHECYQCGIYFDSNEDKVNHEADMH